VATTPTRAYEAKQQMHSKCGHGDRSIHKCVGGELLSIARIGAVTKENLREADYRYQNCAFAAEST
jgi:hypothetical protein